MTNVSFDDVWQRIGAHAGETFTQIRGGTFTYAVGPGGLSPDRTDWTIPTKHFEEAFGVVPLPSTVPVQHLYGPSYIYAVLMDPRIRQTDW